MLLLAEGTTDPSRVELSLLNLSAQLNSTIDACEPTPRSKEDRSHFLE